MTTVNHLDCLAWRLGPHPVGLPAVPLGARKAIHFYTVDFFPLWTGKGFLRTRYTPGDLFRTAEAHIDANYLVWVWQSSCRLRLVGHPDLAGVSGYRWSDLTGNFFKTARDAYYRRRARERKIPAPARDPRPVDEVVFLSDYPRGAHETARPDARTPKEVGRFKY